MLIILDLSVDILCSINRDVIEEKVSELLHAHRAGRHLLVVDRSSGGWIQSNIPLSNMDRSTMARILGGLSQTGGLATAAPKFIRIAAPNGTIRQSNVREISLPIDYAHFRDLVLATCLVVEDIKYDGTI